VHGITLAGLTAGKSMDLADFGENWQAMSCGSGLAKGDRSGKQKAKSDGRKAPSKAVRGLYEIICMHETCGAIVTLL